MITQSELQSDVSVTQVNFKSHGANLEGDLYLPSTSSDKTLPAVVMGHGLSLTRGCGLHPFAETFSAAGIVVLTFDYRGFGGSEGNPRDHISVTQQVQDYQAALAYVRNVKEVDPDRVAVWGTSYSGGIATQVVSEDPYVKALVIQVPNLDNLATGVFLTRRMVTTEPLRGIWVLAKGSIDLVRSIAGFKNSYLPAIGPSGSRHAYTNDESWRILEEIASPDWNNRLTVRDFIGRPFRPIKRVKKISCPIQIFAADADDLTPSKPAYKAAKLARTEVDFHHFDTGHFGVYSGELFKKVVAEQTRFLLKHLA